MGKRHVLAAVFVLLGAAPLALAEPFKFPAKWSVSNPSEVKTGGVLRLSERSNAQTFNPFSSATQARYLTNDGLIITDPTNPNDHIPYMAESFTVSADKRVFTFKIRRGMEWSDGEPITADDWVLTGKLETDEDVESVNAGAYYNGDTPVKIEKIDTYTVRYTFPKASHDNWDVPHFPVAPAHIFGPVYAAKGAAGVKAMWGLNTKPGDIVTAGPWKLVSYQPGERIVYERNPNFAKWNADSANKPVPYLGGMQVLIAKDSNSELAQYLNGNLDVFEPGNADHLAQIKKAIDSNNFKAVLKPNYAPGEVTYALFFNQNRKSAPEKQRLFRSADFRRAISHLTNRKAMVDLAWGGLSQITWTQLPLALGEWVSPNAKRFDYNPEAAKALLAKLGYSNKNSAGYLINRNGAVLEFDITLGAASTVTQKMVQILAEDAKKVGVKINMKLIDAAQIFPLLTSTGDDRAFDASLSATQYTIHPWPLIGQYEMCDLEGNVFHYYNNSGKCLSPEETQISVLYQKGSNEFNDAQRLAIAHQIQNITAEQQFYIFLPAQARHTSWLTRVRGEFPPDKIGGKDGARNLLLTWLSN